MTVPVGLWITFAVLAWFAMMMVGMIGWRKASDAIGIYSKSLHGIPEEELLRFGVPLPETVLTGFEVPYRRFYTRLILWGAPPLSGTSHGDHRAVRRYRLWCLALAMCPFLPLTLMYSLIPLPGGWFLAGFAILALPLGVLQHWPIPWSWSVER